MAISSCLIWLVRVGDAVPPGWSGTSTIVRHGDLRSLRAG